MTTVTAAARSPSRALQGLRTLLGSDLLTPAGHPPHIRRHRAEVIARRVQIVAGIFAVLTPGWIVIDLAVFPWPLWGVLVGLRLASAVAFAVIAFPRRTVTSFKLAAAMLAAMLAVPPAFYLIAHPFLVAADLDPVAQLIAGGYSLLPFIVVAGMSVFPLTVAEVVIASVPVMAVTAWVNLGVFSPDELVRTIWLLALVGGVAVFSGVSQLNYMIALVEQATRDVLTGAATRRSGEDALELYFRIAVRTNGPLTLAFVDLDDFKSINDHFGHEAGDEALRSAAEALRGIVRRSDMLVRWGGEEFLMILPNTDADGLGVILRRLRETGLGLRPDGRPITASIGVAERLGDQVHDWEHLVRVSDDRMYRAKKAGKNRIIGSGDREL